MMKLHDGNTIFTTPHHRLGGLRIYFTLPNGWIAEDVEQDNTNFPRDWWIKHWDQTGISWNLFCKEKGKSSAIEMDALLEGKNRNRKKFTSQVFKTASGLYGFYDRPSFIDLDSYGNFYFIVHLPRYGGKAIDMDCGFRYKKSVKHNIEADFLSLIKSIRLK
ncbi:MAG: hypothetical protein QM758_21580 [Armatimonas sp.]